MRNIVIYALLSLTLATSTLISACSKSDDATLDAYYGYVQFKVVKEASMTEQSTRTDVLEWLSDAHKLTVVMQHEGSTISQTLPLASYDKESAEWGLYSEKLRLMTGDYNIIGIYLYDNLDNELLAGGNQGSFTVECGGLVVKPIGVNTVERGKVSFILGKEFTRSEGSYPFSSIRSIDISVRNKFSGKVTTFPKLATTIVEEFADGSMDEELYGDRRHLSTFAKCEGEHWLEAGNYIVTAYTTYSDAKGKLVLESASIVEQGVEFTVEDNRVSRNVEIPIMLTESAAHIKDYMALKAIWLALDGESWTFHGEEYVAGANWDFNKDIDLWGDQPGVTLDQDGRVVGLNLSGFGAEGVVPEAIGQLTELRLLYLGNHNELIGGYDSASNGRIEALDYYNRLLKYDAREELTPELRRAINSDDKQRPILSGRIGLKDVAFGNLTNGITGVSRAVMRLTKLEQLFIANSPITNEGLFVDIADDSPYAAESMTWSWGNFQNLSDVEIYNCPNLNRLPTDMLAELPNVVSLNIAVNRSISGEQLKKDWETIIDGKSGGSIQILYLGYNNLRETPSFDYLKRMSKLGYLDCSNNKLEVVHPFGKEITPTTLIYDNNQISSIKAADDGYFCGVSQMETFSISGNCLTELPDLFSARSVYGMVTANFSKNLISSLENGDAWRGVNASTLNLANNRFEELPKRIMQSGSRIETLMLGSNGMRRIEEGAMQGEYSHFLTTIDLSYNRLTELPYNDFSALTMPYLYGIDLSSNAFAEFPYAPLSIDHLTVMSIRQQRDNEGNRTLREWPTGLYTCPKMSAFYIGSNDLRKIEDTISPYILLFEIKDNPNISIDLSAVCPYIEMGYYELIYDSTQDIRGCDALNLD